MIDKRRKILEQYGLSSAERVDRALSLLVKGKGILLIDAENREDEGDLIFSAHTMSVADMALMIRECSGIVCLCLTNNKADALDLPYMVTENTSNFQTPFTISIEARTNVTTGISAPDRVETIRTACYQNAKPEDLVKPGHIFPLRANDQGVLGRQGHTEGSVDLMLLAGLEPEAVLCELMNPDGTLSNLVEIDAFAKKQELTVLSIQDIITYRKFVRDYIRL